jgi:hypothetical protein
LTSFNAFLIPDVASAGHGLAALDWKDCVLYVLALNNIILTWIALFNPLITGPDKLLDEYTKNEFLHIKWEVTKNYTQMFYNYFC